MKLTTLLKAGAIGLAALLPGKAEAQVSGNAHYIQSERSDGSQIKLKGFYELPQDVKGFTFVELQEDGYFGKTYLDRGIRNSVIGSRLMAVHGNEPLSETALGLTVSIPNLPEGAYAQAGFLPIWLGNEGDAIGDKAHIGYSFGFPLPLGFNISGFGDWDVLAEEGTQWDYGEFDLSKFLGDRLYFGYNPVLFSDGDALPEWVHRFNVGVKF